MPCLEARRTGATYPPEEHPPVSSMTIDYDCNPIFGTKTTEMFRAIEREREWVREVYVPAPIHNILTGNSDGRVMDEMGKGIEVLFVCLRECVPMWFLMDTKYNHPPPTSFGWPIPALTPFFFCFYVFCVFRLFCCSSERVLTNRAE